MSGRRVVITGGPHSGKTTLLNALAAVGKMTVPEAAIDVIQSGVSRVGVAVFTRWRTKNPREFQRQVTALQQKREAAVFSSKEDVFFDRGLLDGVAYAKVLGVEPPDIDASIGRTRYDVAVVLRLVLPFSERHRTGRTSSLSRARATETALIAAYEQHGVPVVIMPLAPIEVRLSQLLRLLGVCGTGRGGGRG